MTVAAKRAIWLKLGLWPAWLVALAPVVIALLHLMPMAPAPIAAGWAPPAVHHRAEASITPVSHARSASPLHRAVSGEEIAALIAASLPEGCHPPPQSQDEPRDAPIQQARINCPLCLWLQGFHALPVPDAPVLRQPHETTIVSIRRETVLRIATFRAAAQPRAPPVLLPA